MYLGVALAGVALVAWLLYATRPAEEPRPVSAPSAPSGGVGGPR
jgi:hypothetical protein